MKMYYAAQQVECLRGTFKRISHLNVTTLFIFSPTFEDDFNYFFSNFNTVVQFLFHTTSDCLNKDEVLQLLTAHERGISFSNLCYDIYLPCTIVVFIQTLAKMEQHSFLYNQLTNCLVTYFEYKKEFIHRLIRIAIKKTTLSITATVHEQKILKTTRVASVENILNCIEFQDEWELPLSTK